MNKRNVVILLSVIVFAVILLVAYCVIRDRSSNITLTKHHRAIIENVTS